MTAAGRYCVTWGVVSCQAAYHGVPVVAMPFFADQPLNAMKAASKVQVTLILITSLMLGPFGRSGRVLMSQLPVLLTYSSHAC